MPEATNDKQQLVPTVKAVEEQAGQKPQAVLTDIGIARKPNLRIWRRKRSKASLPPTRSLIVTVSSRARGDRYRRERRGWTACDGNCRPRWERRSTPSVENGGGASVWPDQTSARLPAISLAGFAEGARRVGPGLSDAHLSEVTSTLLWIELETTKKGHS